MYDFHVPVENSLGIFTHRRQFENGSVGSIMRHGSNKYRNSLVARRNYRSFSSPLSRDFSATIDKKGNGNLFTNVKITQ